MASLPHMTKSASCESLNLKVGKAKCAGRVPTETGKPGKPGKNKMVMEKSWNEKNWPKGMEFSYQSWNFTKFVCFLPPLRN